MSKWYIWIATPVGMNRLCTTKGRGKCVFTKALGREESRQEVAGIIQVSVEIIM
jgi:hypothetical protein